MLSLTCSHSSTEVGFITPCSSIRSLKGGGQGGRRRWLEGGLNSGRRGGERGGRANYNYFVGEEEERKGEGLYYT